jgi:hypothetical protein
MSVTKRVVTLISLAGLILLGAVDARAQIFVSSGGPNGGTVGEYSLSGQLIAPELIVSSTGIHGLVAADDHLFVLGDSGIGEYGMDGTPVNANLIANSSIGGMAISNGLIYITTGGKIATYNLDGQLVNGSLASGVTGGLIAVGGGDIFVFTPNFAASTGAIAKYTTSGALVNSSLVFVPTPFASSLVATGDSLFSSAGGSNVRYAHDGTVLNSYAVSLQDPSIIAVSGDTVLVSNYVNTIREFTLSGQSVNSDLITLPQGYAFIGGMAIVPEPSAALMLVVGAGLLLSFRKVTGPPLG